MCGDVSLIIGMFCLMISAYSFVVVVIIMFIMNNWKGLKEPKFTNQPANLGLLYSCILT